MLNAYVLTLAALILAAGSLSDIYRRRRIFILGVVVFVIVPRVRPHPGPAARITRTM